MPESDFASVVPAQLSFLTIYNPLLGPTDETLHDQIVFYTSRSDRVRRGESSATEGNGKEIGDEWNKRLRQIGLAQGMVSFARNFSKGQAVDYVETDKSLIVLHELEKDWWILASIDLTRLPTDRANGSLSQRDASGAPSFYYSSREMCPSHLLVQQLRRAHSTFLLHHDITLDALYKRVGRPTLCTLLENFWLRYAWTWEVLLSGNPAVDIFNGIKLSAGGELGIGVGEEEWGSGEREVLEDFVARTDGLMDLIVSRFGDSPMGVDAVSKPASLPGENSEGTRWLGTDIYPRPSDGVIFSGVGNLTRSSVVCVSQWMEWIYRYGVDAYGVGEDPNTPRRRKRRKKQRGRTKRDISTASGTRADSQPEAIDRGFSPGIPRPLVMESPNPPQPPQESVQDSPHSSGESSPARSEKGSDWMGATTGAFVKYLTLGYGTSWSMSMAPTSHPRVEALKREEDSVVAKKQAADSPGSQETLAENATVEESPKPQNHGRFIIGLQGEMANPNNPTAKPADTSDSPARSTQNPINQRTLHLHLSALSEENPQDPAQVRAVVYVHQPFMYTFLFDPQTPSTTDPSLYHTIHNQLSILQEPLTNSTSPANAAAKISTYGNTEITDRFLTKTQQVYDLVYDPTNLTIRSSIPNIPDLGIIASPDTSGESTALWSRVESLNIHHRLLSTHTETRSRPLELERTCKTSRGWWIVWVRMSSSADKENSSSDNTNNNSHQEAFLIRKASDHAVTSLHARNNSGTRFFRDLGGATSSPVSDTTGPGKLVEGLGLDARRYIENLLSLNK
ncbi:hypothetical protein BDV25DRAFT_160682 [Aspergillus avenaceus]|uniref:CCZ1/INTU/HSP4 first Longin domain-containing protein n=1 Tax=Aspergillus avenaceus TaxID=36643 RepID=A0A5N6TLS0_ASPAV|nr:hypothetical protein BDV25DRAFT_160682 [Aspergillus avenaceus]